jgi:hypothetical protein
MNNLFESSGAFDAHVHLGPDLVPRAQPAWDYARDAAAAGMTGAVIKDHCAPTSGVAAALNAAYPGGPCFVGSIVLNPAVGGLNPHAVRTALATGGRVVWFPTYGARFQIQCEGREAMPFPMPPDFNGLTILDDSGSLLPEVWEILRVIAQFDAVLATGHLSPAESLRLLGAGADVGVRRMVVTHASALVPAMSIDDQRAAVEAGAMIEHSLRACGGDSRHPLSHRELAWQIRAIGVPHVLVSSDFGQTGNGAPVAAFAKHLARLAAEGFSDSEIGELSGAAPRRLILQHPVRTATASECPR